MRPCRPRPLVLVIEDDPDVLQILRVNLEAGGMGTALAADGETALQRIDLERPDAILLDLMLPIVDGWEVLADLTSRADPAPVIVCSARRGAAEVHRATRLGAFDYVQKPFDPARVVGAARRATGLDPVVEAAPTVFRARLELGGAVPTP